MTQRIELAPRPVADFYQNLMSVLNEIGINIDSVSIGIIHLCWATSDRGRALSLSEESTITPESEKKQSLLGHQDFHWL